MRSAHVHRYVVTKGVLATESPANAGMHAHASLEAYQIDGPLREPLRQAAGGTGLFWRFRTPGTFSVYSFDGAFTFLGQYSVTTADLERHTGPYAYLQVGAGSQATELDHESNTRTFVAVDATLRLTVWPEFVRGSADRGVVYSEHGLDVRAHRLDVSSSGGTPFSPVSDRFPGPGSYLHSYQVGAIMATLSFAR